MKLSVIIPTLNAASALPACLKQFEAVDDVVEVVVADGGSTDATRDVATAAGARVVIGAASRGSQLRMGARAATGDWLLFLHADTLLGPTWMAEVRQFSCDPNHHTRAAVFRLALDSHAVSARRLERRVDWRTRVLALPYGDQGLLMSRAIYDAIGGYAAIPLMEDVDIITRLGRKRLTYLNCVATTSAQRYLRDGWYRRSARNLICLGLYFCGLPPHFIKRLYG